MAAKAAWHNIGNKRAMTAGIRAVNTHGVVALFERKDVGPHS